MKAIIQLSLFLAWVVLMTLMPGSGLAQGVNPQDRTFAYSQGGAMPAWIVPVLKLVSSTHVEPTTGIVLSPDGLVLVPAEFAAPGDEIIVLDGGTDLLRNGRPARLEHSFSGAGLELLRVDGLKRPGAPVATEEPAAAGQVQLTAFPPAELIAQGEPPIFVTSEVISLPENGKLALSGESSLPNVTGALLDSCGNLVGISVADGIQTIESAPGTRYHWHDTLIALFEELSLSPAPSACGAPATPEPELPVEEVPEPSELEIDPPQTEEPESEEAVDEISGEEEAEDEVVEQAAVPDLDILPPIETDTGEVEETPGEQAATESESGHGWVWLLSAMLLITAGLVIHWLRTRQTASGFEESAESGLALAELEPEAEDETAWTPAPMDSKLHIRGQLGDGSDFEAASTISAAAINLVIGRGDEADLTVDSIAVSRLHARLNGTPELLTLADLGSNNGSAINGVPCLEGEVLFVEPGDTVTLGDVRFTVEIETASGD